MVKPFLRWLDDVGEQCSEAEKQIYNMVLAFRDARREVVPPGWITVNRARRTKLVYSNAFGRYTAEIAALDQDYVRYWVEDGEAMKRYRRRLSDALSRLTPWQQPPSIANNTGLIQPIPLPTDRLGL
ncbi:PPE family protein [Mycobacterium haemophilum]|uniref:PPE family protein n=2 Tax=Mycobacterium haemophilum TaxID=29311 RepID=UPI0006998672|nr:PPE domain-containing protein [Mycobacterium haemophilum]